MHPKIAVTRDNTLSKEPLLVAWLVHWQEFSVHFTLKSEQAPGEKAPEERKRQRVPFFCGCC
jgi:hypothetical protein